MMINKINAFLEKNFSGKNLIVVSNREPYIHKRTESTLRVERPAGGLTSAMDDVLKATGGVWVAWGCGSGDRDVVDVNNLVPVPPERPSYLLKRVWLNNLEVEHYYHGYSNQVLWPLCHIALDRIYIRKRFWEDYKAANRKFALAVIEEASQDSVVWIHDYHLSLLPGILREQKPELTIAHFWHIPWPDWSVFRVCPQAKEITQGLLGNDLIGFQIPLFIKNFLECVQETVEADIDYNTATIKYKGHTTRVKAFPISIDFDKFNSLASSRRTLRLIKSIKRKYGLAEGYVGIGVDRLEYTKALIKRLQAIDLFFDRYDRFRKRFTFIQVAAPTRMREPYISYKKAVEQLVLRINRKHSDHSWKPIIFIDKKISHENLVPYYRMADVAIISSIYDGMNLVAKEYVASQVDSKGVLILSEFAGAADELEGAILINPYDIESFSDAIKMALTISPGEKTGKMDLLRYQIRTNDIYKWFSDILREIVNTSSLKKRMVRYLFDHLDELPVKDIFLLLDYDGTLTPIVESPDSAFLSANIRSLLMKLRQYMPVAVISGRNLEDIKERVGVDGIIYAGNHGAEIWDGKEIVKTQGLDIRRDLLEEFLDKLKTRLAHIEGLLIEDKGITASVHFRLVKIKDLAEFFDIFSEIAGKYENSFKITSGKKVFEIRSPGAWNKGDAISWIMENAGKDKLPIYIGDDITDEDAYRAIEGKGISICIGISSEADFYLEHQREVEALLQYLLIKMAR